jgi:hypothetical protein
MSFEKSERADVVRKINLVEAALNADARAPRATRLGDRVLVTDALGKEVVTLEVDGERLWLSSRRDVQRLGVAAIVDLVERLTSPAP